MVIVSPSQFATRRTLFHAFVRFFLLIPTTTRLYTLSLHDALPISGSQSGSVGSDGGSSIAYGPAPYTGFPPTIDRKSTRLNSSHPSISYAVFCLKKKIHSITF